MHYLRGGFYGNNNNNNNNNNNTILNDTGNSLITNTRPFT